LEGKQFVALGLEIAQLRKNIEEKQSGFGSTCGFLLLRKTAVQNRGSKIIDNNVHKV
jgi:hypothetical protein